MASAIRSVMRLVLPLIKQRIIDEDVVTVDQVWITLDDSPKLPNADQLVLLHLGGFRTVQGMEDRIDQRLYRMLDVICHTRMVLDEVARGEVQLLQDDTGHLALEDKVIDAIHKFQPTDGDGNALTFEPIWLDMGREPRKLPKEKGWVKSAIPFTIPIEQDDDQSFQ